MTAEGGTRAVVAALLANTGIAVTKFVAFALTGMSSMLAEGIHSVADSGNQGLLLLGGRRAKRPATPEHPFGYGRERYVHAFIVSIVLFSVGGLFALYEAYKKWRESHDLTRFDPFDNRWWWVPLVVLAVAIVLESLSFRTAMREGNRSRGRRPWVEYIQAAKAPELPVIILEDFAALVGLVLALLGVGLTLLTSNPLFDVLGTACIGLLLVAVAVVLAVEMKSLLLGESATPADQRVIAEAISETEGVDRIIHMKTLHLGPEEVLVGVKIAVGRADAADEIARAINAAEESARAAVPHLRLVMYVEPDLDRAARTTGPAASPAG
jgi:cation diffusion facilitator family transporter